MTPEDLKYSKDHEWVKVDGLKAQIGITHHAQDQLGDIVFVEVPEIGRVLEEGEVFGVVESVKTVSDLFAPVAGKVIEVNECLVESSENFTPEVVNSSPYDKGWMVTLEVADASVFDALLDQAGYLAHVESEA